MSRQKSIGLLTGVSEAETRAEGIPLPERPDTLTRATPSGATQPFEALFFEALSGRWQATSACYVQLR